MHPSVSVIIPNYNHARYLNERIQSVLNQTYQDFEVIILDDKSTDNSQEVIEKYRNHPKVSHIVFNEENSGSTFKQWDKGFGLAKGDLIWIAESDDSCDRKLLETLVAAHEKSHSVVTFCRSRVMDENSKLQEIYISQQKLENDLTCPGDDFIRRYMLDANIVVNASSAIFKKKKALMVRPTYKTMKGEGDMLFWVEMMHGGIVSFIAAPLNLFRQHSTNTTKGLCNAGVNFKEHKQVYDFIVKEKIIGWTEAFTHRFWRVFYYSKESYQTEEQKKSVMDTWDKYHFHRLFTPLMNLYIKFKNKHHGGESF